ncbi:MAG: hypothetical protein WAQ28_04780 [Bacteroidia bacterium]|jgi:hypothetical protein
MRKELQKYISIAVLLLFLFPMVEKQVHAFEHLSDKHCTANEKHFHELEHHCDVCVFTLGDSSPETGADYHFINSSEQFTYSISVERVYIKRILTNLPARAPPIA